MLKECQKCCEDTFTIEENVVKCKETKIILKKFIIRKDKTYKIDIRLNSIEETLTVSTKFF